MIRELEQLDDLGNAMMRRAREARVSLIWRAQSRSSRRITVRNGTTESCTLSSSSGHGAQLITPDGRVILGNRDDFSESAALAMLDRLIQLAAEAGALGLEPTSMPELEAVRSRSIPPDHDAFARVDLARVGSRLIELEQEIRATCSAVQLVVSYGAVLDAWRILRDDGTDVLFAVPGCTLSVRATSDVDNSRHGVSASYFDSSPELPWMASATDPFLKRATRAGQLAAALPEAPTHPAGSFPLIIDYALAKGLAHEAFGHASEADGFRSSILARDGRFRAGERVGAEHVSIIDEPLEGDHAWQPFSANGLPRRRAVIVDHGRLREALSDPFSAETGGVPLTAAGRAESFRCAPQPRMTNIRIEVDQPLPAPGEFEDYGPCEVRELLLGAGVFERHPRITFLSGYGGGQVNTASGDFVFHCKAIYDLTPDEIVLFKPAIFSGSMFGALQSVREAFGPLKLDAIGYCGKWGQSVPSSGGSHYFLMLDPHPTVRLGGR